MSQHRKNAFLTISVKTGANLGMVTCILLCSLIAHASPNTDLIPDPVDTSPQRNIQDPHNDVPIYPTRQLTQDVSALGLGLLSGNLNKTDTIDTTVLFNYHREFYDTATLAHEYVIGLTGTSLIQAEMGLKRLLYLQHYNEPYFGVFVGALYQPSENFATLINWQRYRLTGEVGLEDFCSFHRRIRADATFTWSGMGFSYGFMFSHAF